MTGPLLEFFPKSLLLAFFLLVFTEHCRKFCLFYKSMETCTCQGNFRWEYLSLWLSTSCCRFLCSDLNFNITLTLVVASALLEVRDIQEFCCRHELTNLSLSRSLFFARLLHILSYWPWLWALHIATGPNWSNASEITPYFPSCLFDRRTPNFSSFSPIKRSKQNK